MTLTVPEVLRKAADLIEPEGAWTQGEMGRDHTGERVSCRSDAAVKFCALGAISRAGDGALEDEAAQILRDVVKPRRNDIARWNDAPGRQQSEVVAALREAADRAEGL